MLNSKRNYNELFTELGSDNVLAIRRDTIYEVDTVLVLAIPKQVSDSYRTLTDAHAYEQVVGEDEFISDKYSRVRDLRKLVNNMLTCKEEECDELFAEAIHSVAGIHERRKLEISKGKWFGGGKEA